MTTPRKRAPKRTAASATRRLDDVDDERDFVDAALAFTFGGARSADAEEDEADEAADPLVADALAPPLPLGADDPELQHFLRSFDEEKNEFNVMAMNGIVAAGAPSLSARATINVTNNVVQARLNMPIDWRFVIPRAYRYGMKFATKNFGAIDMACLKPKVTMRTYSSGKISCSGARDVADAIFSIQTMLNILRSLRDHYNIITYEALRCTSVKLVNVVGDIELGFPIDLHKLAEHSFVKYHPEEWPTANIRLREMNPDTYMDRKVIALVSSEGKVVISGAHSRADLVQIYGDILPVMQACATAVPRQKMITAAAAAVTDEQRRTEMKRKRMMELPQTSRAVIKIQHLGVEEFEVESTAAVAVIEPTTVALQQFSKKRGVPTGSEVARNLIALKSMDERNVIARRELEDELEHEANDTVGKTVKIVPQQEARLLAMLHD